MSGAKNFGIRSSPDPIAIRRSPPPPPVPPPEPGAAGSCCCRCRCRCSSPAQVAPPSIPAQLLTPFPEPPVLRRPLPSAGAGTVGTPLARPADSPVPIPTSATGPDPSSAAGRALCYTAAPGNPGVTTDSGTHRRTPSDPGPTPASMAQRVTCCHAAAVMFQGGEEDDHPYVRVLETPAPERPLLARYLQPISWGGIGFASAFVFNLFARKPPLAGIQRHIALGGIGWVAGLYINKWIESNSAERDAVLKHYIQLHPEDFPVPERKKYSEILQPWSPLR
ncbi:ethylene-responsive transcription factor ABI4-like isoform X2 [Amphibalanus amphitrite]|uniref:ethylene-responsive transcription factor ABI4-like isoform X2 n=1 Tax=Amphibalanus amphitrite TaxID=1232801 RepID=UPI001C91AD09|nr:ethylene-responsive transcription factor ABI4-like isoform X2 [Amphibalanus amphitrite]